jgi:hypothetical protein
MAGKNLYRTQQSGHEEGVYAPLFSLPRTRRGTTVTSERVVEQQATHHQTGKK